MKPKATKKQIFWRVMIGLQLLGLLCFLILMGLFAASLYLEF